MKLRAQRGLHHVVIEDVVADTDVRIMGVDAQQFARLQANLPYEMGRLVGEALNAHRRHAQDKFEERFERFVAGGVDRAEAAFTPYRDVYQAVALRDEYVHVTRTARTLTVCDRIVIVVDQWRRNGEDRLNELAIDLGVADELPRIVRLCKLVQRLTGERLRAWHTLTHTSYRRLKRKAEAMNASKLSGTVVPALTCLLFALPALVLGLLEKVH